MLEDDDYRLISDQLYLLPFLRKYANFLDIDQDETAMRLLREVQRADNSQSPVRVDPPFDEIRRYQRRNWSKPIMFSALIAVIVGAYIAQSHHKDADTISSPPLQSPQGALVSPSSSASHGAVNSLPVAQSVSTDFVNRSHSHVSQQTISGRTTSAPEGTQTGHQAITVRIVRGDAPTKLTQGNNPHDRPDLNH
jgi:cytoskeletal protein RodZ